MGDGGRVATLAHMMMMATRMTTSVVGVEWRPMGSWLTMMTTKGVVVGRDGSKGRAKLGGNGVGIGCAAR